MTTIHHQDKDREIPETKPVWDVANLQFRGHDGETIDPEKYMKVVVYGDSLDLFGIYHDNMVFIESRVNPYTVEYPKACLFNRNDYVADEPNNKSKFSLARVWMIASDTDRIVDINNTILSKEFEPVLNDPRFCDYDYIYANVNWDFPPDEKAAIVSRVNSDNRFVLEFRRLSDIVGVAKYAFNDYGK